MVSAVEGRFPRGAAITLDQLDADPYPALADLREHEPVSWVPVLDGWLVTRRDLCIEVMRDAARFTVDDPAVLHRPGGRSEHAVARWRRAPTPQGPVRLGLCASPRSRTRYTDAVEREARRLVEVLAPNGRAEIRRDLAGPLAVNVVAACARTP